MAARRSTHPNNQGYERKLKMWLPAAISLFAVKLTVGAQFTSSASFKALEKLNGCLIVIL